MESLLDLLLLPCGVVTHHHPSSRDCRDLQRPRDEGTAMQMLCAHQRAGTRGGVGKSLPLQATREMRSRSRLDPRSLGRVVSFDLEVSDVSQWRPSHRRQWGENLQIYLWQSLPSLQPTAVFTDGKRMSSWIKCTRACQNFKHYINSQGKDRQQAFEMKGKNQWNCKIMLRIRIPHYIKYTLPWWLQSQKDLTIIFWFKYNLIWLIPHLIFWARREG